MLRATLLVSTALICAAGITACERSAPRQPAALKDQNAGPQPGAQGSDKFSLIEAATAEIAATSDRQVKGTARFTPDTGQNQIKIELSLSGLTPGLHGFHIHTHPDCGDNGKAAGPHFNPHGEEHGAPNSERQHVGDLGNIEADAEGKVNTVITSRKLAFSGPNNVLHHTVVIHANEDDLHSQPSGNAGDRIACGIIRPAQDILANQ